jgi:glycosyltransferase involved in cell wall biosynthesis
MELNMTLSLCMIVKNEEKHLDRCLKSVRGIFDEIIIADTGSIDTTKEIAYKYTDKVYDFAWIEDFAAARNFAFSKANSEYLMWLDADDIIPEKSRRELIKLKDIITSDIDVVRLPYNTGYDADGNITFSFYRERILKNCEAAKFKGFIHEVVDPFGRIISVDIPIEHHKIAGNERGRNLRIYEKHLADGDEFSPRDVFYYARELSYKNRNSDAVRAFTKFINERKGWIENNIEACKIRAECYERLRERQNAYISLYSSFFYDTPRAEVCCEIGRMLLEDGEFNKAIFWYKIAYGKEPDFQSGGFVLPDCYGYIPAIQICVCYSRMGDEKTAEEWNEKAAAYKVTAAVRYNRDYFAGLKAPYKLVKY